MLTYQQALRRILNAVPRPRVRAARLAEALGHVVATPLTARTDLPRFDHSAVDGYAVRSNDPSPLRLIGRSEAGRPFHSRLLRGEAVRILTGAAIPQGADAVVMQEHVTVREIGRAHV